jgi:hypothetical protein
MSDIENEIENVCDLFAYSMGEAYWDTESYDEECDESYIVTFTPDGVPLYVDTGISLLDYAEECVVRKPKHGLFVLDTDYQLHMSPQCNIFHHSDFLHGRNVLCAGEYALHSTGEIRAITNKSGHYMPNADCLEDVIEIIRANGFDGNIRVKYY